MVVHRIQEEVGRELASRERHRRVVERRQQFLPFPGQQGRQFRNAACRVLRNLVQDLLEAPQNAFDLGGGEPRGVVESRQVQLVATLLDGEAERIVRSLTHPLELEPEFAVGVGVVKREVLERVEGANQVGAIHPPLNVGEGGVVVRQGRSRLGTEVPQEIVKALPGGAENAHRNCVDEQTHHGFGVRMVAAGDYLAEDDVIAPVGALEHESPSSLDDGAEGGAVCGGDAGQTLGELPGGVELHTPGVAHPVGGFGRGELTASLVARQQVAPVGSGGG